MIGPATVGPATVGPETLGLATVGPEAVGPETEGPETVGPEMETAGSATVGTKTEKRPDCIQYVYIYTHVYVVMKRLHDTKTEKARLHSEKNCEAAARKQHGQMADCIKTYILCLVKRTFYPEPKRKKANLHFK